MSVIAMALGLHATVVVLGPSSLVPPLGRGLPAAPGLDLPEALLEALELALAAVGIGGVGGGGRADGGDGEKGGKPGLLEHAEEYRPGGRPLSAGFLSVS